MMAERRKKDDSPTPTTYEGFALQRLADARALAGRGERKRAATSAKEAVAFFMQAVEPVLDTEPRTKVTERSGWLRAVRFLADFPLFKTQLNSLALALAELDRGFAHPALKPTGSRQGGKDSADKLRWKAIAVEAFEMIVEQHGGNKTAALNSIEVDLAIPTSTMNAWRRDVQRAAIELKPGASLRLRMVRDKPKNPRDKEERWKRLDPATALRLAREEIKRK